MTNENLSCVKTVVDQLALDTDEKNICVVVKDIISAESLLECEDLLPDGIYYLSDCAVGVSRRMDKVATHLIVGADIGIQDLQTLFRDPLIKNELILNNGLEIYFFCSSLKGEEVCQVLTGWTQNDVSYEVREFKGCNSLYFSIKSLVI